MNKSFKELQNIYEAHYYNNLSPEEKDLYYTNIIEQIEEYLKKYNDIAKEIYNLSQDLEYIDLKNLQKLFESHTENPAIEFRDFRGFILDKLSSLRHVAHDLEYENMRSELTDILTGNKLQ
jgi:hypothetical protein